MQMNAKIILYFSNLLYLEFEELVLNRITFKVSPAYPSPLVVTYPNVHNI